MTREEIEQKMDELARKYTETRAPKIREEIYRLDRELETMEKLEAVKIVVDDV
jgi:FKBP-type peptidyl-prolyl cis-trans isomerase (trigger factor)